MVLCSPVPKVFPVGHHSDRFTGRAVQLRRVVAGRRPLALNVGL